jgi:predicted membrane protein
MLCSFLVRLGPVGLALVQAVAPLLVVARRVAPLLGPVGLALARRVVLVRRVAPVLAPPGQALGY